MRKIEKLMLQAVWNKQNFLLDNTRVSYNENTQTSLIRLFENLIATYKHDGLYKVKVEKAMFVDFPTRTTRGRLRALGINATIKQGRAAIDGVIL
tara:strand:+ start:417 stop:701 length:285 start_codon:yes stop_codon:yes gene_type:complete